MTEKMNLNIPEPVTEGVFPESQSMSGTNAFYHYCEAANGRQSYAVCRHAMKKADENTLSPGSMCAAPIRCGSCEAIPMRAAELNSGRALYFIDRSQIIEENKLRVAHRESLVKPRQMLGGIGSLIEKNKGGIKQGRLDLMASGHKTGKAAFTPKPKEQDLDQMLHAESEVMETALSSANHEEK